MAIKRVMVETVADPRHGSIFLEGEHHDELPQDRVYVDPHTGIVLDGGKGHRLADLRGNEIELPKTTWYFNDI